ncbi:MAG TPA: IS1182 family transposase [Actinomycetes bacterium]|nr:IS1182 family transposase [Actinomycetes bacterium]
MPERSIYRLLHRERDRLFPDELFADLYVHHGRRSVPPSILAVVMVLQRLEGCSDREAVDRFAYDLRWRYAAGVDDEMGSFAHTVLVELRARLRASGDPDRIFRVTTELARQAGLVGVRRVLDSAPLYDAVATQDTVTLLRGAIRGLLRACPAELAGLVRAALARDDDYAAAGKPICDWDDPQAREQLVDALFRDGYRALGALRGKQLGPEVAQAAELLATVIGQDIEETADGRFIIAQGVAPDRVISVVDPQARHGHKTGARGFDGYKGHVAIDPDSEVICAAEVGPANTGDAAMAQALLADLPSASAPPAGDPAADAAAPDQTPAATGQSPVVYGDAAYGTGALLTDLEQRGINAMTKVAAPTAPHGHFTKQQFRIDLDQHTVTCPARLTVAIIPARQGGGVARFGKACQVCPLQGSCTSSAAERTITIHPQEARLATARSRQREPGWRADYRAHRPTVERKLAHLLRRRHGGRRARVRGLVRVDQDWRLLAAAVNLARFAVLGLRSRPGGWAVAPA